jgi:plastocyanin
MSTLGEAARTNAVAILSDGFEPRVVEVRTGSTVTWTNEDHRTHTVSSAEIESGEIEAGAGFSYTFERPGHYRYFCMIHPRDVAEVFVR